MNEAKAICSWSGGKDSCLALYRARKAGYEVTHLLNFISRETGRGCFHGIEGALMRMQADSLGIPLVQKETTADMATYEAEFKEAVLSLKGTGATHMIFGDIYLIEHARWVERVCAEIGVTPVSPLWNDPPETIVKEFLGLGFRALVVSCKADIFDISFAGRFIDTTMIDDCKRRGACPCGENGEYHTLVVDGPLFARRIEIVESKAILRNGFWKHYFLDIKKYRHGE